MARAGGSGSAAAGSGPIAGRPPGCRSTGRGYIEFRKRAEGWPSGLRRTLGKRVYGKPYRGFESHSLRHRLLKSGSRDEVGRDVAAVELHALEHFELGLERLSLLNRDHAFVADPLHRIGDEPTNLCIATGRDSANLGDLLVRGNFFGVLLEVRDNGLDRKIAREPNCHREPGAHS